jgi:erythritol transport system ATP-binding protein
MAIGDVITILRDGKFQAEAKVCDIDVPWIVREMLGSDPVSNFLKPGRTFGAPVLEAEHITCVNSAGNAVVDDVSFKVHSGEIVGIYGLMGAGRTELFECMLGTERNYLGKLWLDSKPVPQRLATADRIRMGMSLVPEDRNVPVFSHLVGGDQSDHRQPVAAVTAWDHHFAKRGAGGGGQHHW